MNQPHLSSFQPLMGPQMLDAVLRSAVGAIITIDDRGIIQSANPATQILFGYQEAELSGQNVRILMPEPFRSEHNGYIRHHLDTGEKKIIGIGREVTGQRKDGSIFPIHLSVSAFEIEGKRYFAGILHDLSARKEAQTKLSEQRSLFQAVFDHVPDALVVLDANHRIALVNPALSRIFGYAADELTGQDTRLLYASDEEYARVGRFVQAVHAGVGQEPLAVSFRRKDGELFTGRVSGGAIRNPDGRSLWFVGAIRDISEDLRKEQALRRAQRLDAVGQLSSGVAHDFNNVLTIITGNLELLDAVLDDAVDRDPLRRASEAAEMGARLTHRLLTFARRRQFAPEVLNLNEQVLGLMNMMRRTLGESINLSTTLSPGLWSVKVDPGEIENAILNLAINARDAMPSGGSLVIETTNAIIDEAMAATEPGLRPGEYARLSVSDTGTGMSPDIVARVFEPFFTTKQPGKGTGLGLAGIYGFIKQSGGHVAIYSEVGRGTTCHLYLPRLAVDEPSPARKSSPSNVDKGAGQTVLVVEDNADVRQLTLTRLKVLGYSALEANSGPSAIEILRAGAQVDLVFSDVVMAGGMSGFDVAKWVHQNRPGIRLLLTSGFTDDVIRTRETDAADVRILNKPYSLVGLGQALRRALDGE